MKINLDQKAQGRGNRGWNPRSRIDHHLRPTRDCLIKPNRRWFARACDLVSATRRLNPLCCRSIAGNDYRLCDMIKRPIDQRRSVSKCAARFTVLRLALTIPRNHHEEFHLLHAELSFGSPCVSAQFMKTQYPRVGKAFTRG